MPTIDELIKKDSALEDAGNKLVQALLKFSDNNYSNEFKSQSDDALAAYTEAVKRARAIEENP